MPLECGIIFDGIPEGAISRKVGLIWGIPVTMVLSIAELEVVARALEILDRGADHLEAANSDAVAVPGVGTTEGARD